MKTPSAAGLLQMLPRQTNRTEKGLFVVVVGVVDSVVEVDIDVTVSGL